MTDIRKIFVPNEPGIETRYQLLVSFPKGVPSYPRCTREWLDDFSFRFEACSFHTCWYLQARAQHFVAGPGYNHTTRYQALIDEISYEMKVDIDGSIRIVLFMLMGDLMRAISSGRDWPHG